MEVVKKDIQERILESIKAQLPKGEKLAQIMMDTLFLSQDAVYRRLRGDVALSIHETKTLCEAFNISFDEFGTYKKGQVSFLYNPLNKIGPNFESYIVGMRDGLREMKELENVKLIMSVNDTPMFQMFNLPHLTRFKYFYWARTYLKIPEYLNQKFKREKIDKKVLQIGIEAHNIYNSLPSYEIYGPETLRGILRQIQYFFESHLFEDPSYALELLDNLLQLLEHIKTQAEIGRKFARGNEPPSSGNEFHMFSNDTYIPDNTYLVKWEGGLAVYLTHNIMNYLQTSDPYYTAESEFMLDSLISNSSPISAVNAKERDRFFASIERTVLNFKRKVESELEI